MCVSDLSAPGAPGDRFVNLAFQEASAEVDRAVNATISALFSNDKGQPSPYSLMRMLRFPDATSRNLARAADVYERTLVNIRKHINAGVKINLTDSKFFFTSFFVLETYFLTVIVVIQDVLFMN